MKLLFVHGWGYSNAFWKPLTDHFERRYFDFLDLGFFKHSKTTRQTIENILNSPKDYIIVGHSLGLMYVLNQFPVQFYHYVGINSFLCFARRNDFKEGVPKRILEKMLARVAKEPLEVLKKFYRQCGYKNLNWLGESQLDMKRLCFGLQLLIELDLRGMLADIGDKLTVIASEKDPIVPKSMVMESYRNHDVHWVNDHSHILPHTHTQKCVELLKEIV